MYSTLEPPSGSGCVTGLPAASVRWHCGRSMSDLRLGSRDDVGKVIVQEGRADGEVVGDIQVESKRQVIRFLGFQGLVPYGGVRDSGKNLPPPPPLRQLVAGVTCRQTALPATWVDWVCTTVGALNDCPREARRLKRFVGCHSIAIFGLVFEKLPL